MDELQDHIASLEDVAEAYRGLYKAADGGGFSLGIKLPGAGDAAKLKEFRDNNTALKEKLETANTSLGEYTALGNRERIDSALALLSTAEKAQEADLLKAGKFDEVFEARTVSLVREHGEALAAGVTAVEAKDKTIAILTAKVGEYTIDGAVMKALDAMEVKVRKGAPEHIKRTAREVFTINEKGETVAKSGKYDDDGAPFTPATFAASLPKTSSFFFEKSGGGGAGGDDEIVVEDGVIWIDPSDKKAISRNAEKIADGRAKVRRPTS